MVDEIVVVKPAERILTTNSVPHISNAIDLSDLLATPVADFLKSQNKTHVLRG